MSEIIVIGHRNPDTDSACAAWSYARYKNAVDPQHRYRAAVCGQLGRQAKFVFTNAGVEPPPYLKDVIPRVGDIAEDAGIRLDQNDPLKMAFHDLDTPRLSVVPVFDDAKNFAGIVGVHEMLGYFVEGTVKSRPFYTFRADNIEKVIPGYFLKRGRDDEFRAPIMAGAMALDQSAKRLDALAPAKPIMIVGNRPELIDMAINREVPAIILTGYEAGETPSVDFGGFAGSVYVSTCDTSETIRMLRLSLPVKQIMDTKPLCLPHDELFDAAKKTLLNTEHHGLPVLKDGRFVGVVTRESFIEKPRRKLILIDHNELSQAVAGAEDAEICEIIDHHRMGAEKTNTPIYIYCKPIGSSCSIVYSHFRMAGVAPDRETALLMLSGLLSDTMLLRSPTTTPEDRLYAPELARLAGVDLQEYGTLMLSLTASLKQTDPLQMVTGDFKEYAECGFRVGVSQVEVGTLADMDEVKANILAALERVCKERNLTWALLLVTDVTREHSVLLCSPWPAAAKEFAYKRLEENIFDLPGILSRKKQLLPEILRILDVVGKG
ncbi:putative manganese-dependent inorganic diphosphatase [Propionivibrio sp.]|uniref:putative manganese-dependent inorganic diphosphatase n=1 Tax=Propionivibrio sp. TaxID=2212460 RepID=UPI0039E3E8D9